MAQSPKLRATRWWWVMKPTHSTRKEMLDFNPTVRYQRDLTTTSRLARHSYWNLTFSTPRLGWPWTVRRNRRHSSFPHGDTFQQPNVTTSPLSTQKARSARRGYREKWEGKREYRKMCRDLCRKIHDDLRIRLLFPFVYLLEDKKCVDQWQCWQTQTPVTKIIVTYRNQKELILPIRLSPALWSSRGRIQYYSLKIPHEYWKLYRYAEMRDCMLY